MVFVIAGLILLFGVALGYLWTKYMPPLIGDSDDYR
jgi:hypothetical protein